MGKNFSRNNASGKRKESDFYETPECLTREFLNADGKNWNLDKMVLEPACGDRAIVRVLEEYGFSHMRFYDLRDNMDFFEDERKVESLITNPPFSMAGAFILHAKEIVEHQFAMLLPLTYLQGSARLREIWSDTEFPLARIYVFNRYPMLGEPLRADGKIKTGMMALAFFVWDRRYTGEPVIRWLDIDKYILKKRG